MNPVVASAFCLEALTSHGAEGAPPEEYIMRNAGLEETQAGIKIAGRNINNLRFIYE